MGLFAFRETGLRWFGVVWFDLICSGVIDNITDANSGC